MLDVLFAGEKRGQKRCLFFGWDIILELWPFPLNGLQVDSRKTVTRAHSYEIKRGGCLELFLKMAAFYVSEPNI